jgi:sigma-E factor negative regulatory protein RseB
MFLLLSLLFVPASTWADESKDSLDWLKTSAFAGRQTDYSGVFVYQSDDRVESSRIIHVLEEDGEFERIERLDGPNREIVRHHGQVWSYLDHKLMQLDVDHAQSRFPDFLPERLAMLENNYRPKILGGDRVAGYDTQVVLFRPKDNLRYSHKIWVHHDSGLLLKSAVLDDKGQTVEQYSFTQLKIGGAIDRAWIRELQADMQKTSAPVKLNRTINSGWMVGALPRGFKKTMEVERLIRGKHAPVIQIVYSDGFGAISVFIEPDDHDEDDVEGLSTRGSVTIYHKVVGEHLVTVVGEVPPRTVMRVHDSVRRKGD